MNFPYYTENISQHVELIIEPIYPNIFKFLPFVLLFKDFTIQNFKGVLCYQIALFQSLSVSYAGKTSGV